MARFGLALLAALVLLVICSRITQPQKFPETLVALGYGERSVTRVEFSTFSDLTSLVEQLNYTAETWAAGQREVPRLVFVRIPERFAAVTVNEVTVEQKKSLFFRMVLPVLLIANEEIAAERELLMQLKEALATQRFLDARQLKTLRRLADKYEVTMQGDAVSITAVLGVLERRIDIVPPSLGLAQAASESGWGTSRFAQEGNALFGQWRLDGKGMVPEEQRSSKGDYKVAKFKTPLGSARSYLRNLNTHGAYREFRKRRAAARADGRPLSGATLASFLTRYSERGADYVKEIVSIIKSNNLSVLDRSYLVDGDVYELVPVWRAEG
ncbi:glucosaminidase domain-containing protein [Nisaea sp.]|uniref:glucosaminidase domain-containing protein n=1 Tax=Nisaea sp. TaxID=2024842 RepID=UPI0032F05E6B